MVTRLGPHYVYIVRCKDGTLYTGYTNSLAKRLKLHNSGHGSKYLKTKLPIKIVYTKEYKYNKNVRHAERSLRKLTRKQKEELIEIYKRSKLIPTDLKKI